MAPNSYEKAEPHERNQKGWVTHGTAPHQWPEALRAKPAVSQHKVLAEKKGASQKGNPHIFKITACSDSHFRIVRTRAHAGASKHLQRVGTIREDPVSVLVPRGKKSGACISRTSLGQHVRLLLREMGVSTTHTWQ